MCYSVGCVGSTRDSTCREFNVRDLMSPELTKQQIWVQTQSFGADST